MDNLGFIFQPIFMLIVFLIFQSTFGNLIVVIGCFKLMTRIIFI